MHVRLPQISGQDHQGADARGSTAARRPRPDERGSCPPGHLHDLVARQVAGVRSRRRMPRVLRGRYAAHLASSRAVRCAFAHAMCRHAPALAHEHVLVCCRSLVSHMCVYTALDIRAQACGALGRGTDSSSSTAPASRCAAPPPSPRAWRTATRMALRMASWA